MGFLVNVERTDADLVHPLEVARAALTDMEELKSWLGGSRLSVDERCARRLLGVAVSRT